MRYHIQEVSEAIAHIRKNKVSGIRVAAPPGLGGPHGFADEGGDVDFDSGPGIRDLVDFPEELITDMVYHAVVGIAPPLPVVGEGNATKSGLALSVWADTVVERILKYFVSVGDLAASPVDVHNLSLVQASTSFEGEESCGLDFALRYVHWDSYSVDGACEGRYVNVTDGKVNYMDVGWGRCHIVDFGSSLRDGRTHGAEISATPRFSVRAPQTIFRAPSQYDLLAPRS